MKFLSVASLLAIAGCSVLHSPPANAGTVIVSWDNPTLNTDDTAIAATQGEPEALQTWRIEYGTCAGTAFGTKLGEFVRVRAAAGLPLTSATQNLPAGNKCFRVFVANFAARESGASNVSVRDIPAATPKPPVNVSAVLSGS
jgi:hypothetical protein